MDYIQPPAIADWYGVENMDDLSGRNIPYGGQGRVQPTFVDAYGSGQAVPYGASGYTQPVYSDKYGAAGDFVTTLTTANFVTGFLVGAIGVLVLGYVARKKEMAPQ